MRKANPYKKLYDVLVKITRVFPNLYIFKNGYCISSNVEKPFLIILSEDQIDEFVKLVGNFELINITNIAKFKKAISNIANEYEKSDNKNNSTKVEPVVEVDGSYYALIETDKKTEDGSNEDDTDKDYTKYYHEVTSKTEKNIAVSLVELRLKQINMINNWNKFILDPDEDRNSELVNEIFKNNNYAYFKPCDNIDGPDILLTKSLLPLITEKNYNEVYYSSKKIEEKLYIIIFDIQLDIFRLYMFHFYIPM